MIDMLLLPKFHRPTSDELYMKVNHDKFSHEFTLATMTLVFLETFFPYFGQKGGRGSSMPS